MNVNQKKPSFPVPDTDHKVIKRTVARDVFWPNHSFLIWIEHIWKLFEFGLLLTKVGQDFAHLVL
jgi:hypothetical protein